SPTTSIRRGCGSVSSDRSATRSSCRRSTRRSPRCADGLAAAREPGVGGGPMPAPLAHLRVVDLTDIRGAFAGRPLGDLGADVVKVEPPRGDPGRLRAPFAGGVAAPDRSLAFLYRNASKRGAVIDLHAADGWRRFCELCERADVLVENLGPDDQRRH